MHKRRLLAIGLTSLLFAGSAAAQLGPALAGRSAAAQNAITVNQNPAGLMRLSKFEVASNTTLIVGFSEFRVDENKSTETGGDPDNETFFGGIPEFAISTPIGDRFSVGLGFSIPTGFGSDYGNDWAGRYFSDDFSLVFMNIQPVVAARVTDWLYIGAGAALMYSSSETKVSVKNAPGLDDGSMKLDVDGFSAGPVISALFLPTDSLRLGITWRGEIDPDLQGRPKFRGLGPAREAALENLGLLGQDIQLGLQIPQTVQAGFFYQATPELAVMADLSWIDFSRFGTVDVRVADFSTTAKNQFRDIYLASAGAEYRFNEKWKGAVGVSYLSSGVSDNNRTLSIAVA